jgi:hypothetical protein
MKTSFPLRGISRSTPNRSGREDPNAAQDGDCDEVINLRYRNGAWRPMGKKAALGVHPNLPGNMSIKDIYIHSTPDGREVWVVRYAEYAGLYYFVMQDSSTLSSIAISSLTGEHDVSLSHVGNVLIISNNTTGVVSWAVFSPQSSSYTYIAEIPELPTVKFSTLLLGIGEEDRSASAEGPKVGAKVDDPASKKIYDEIGAALATGIAKINASILNSHNAACGLLLMQCAIEMIDGSVVRHSPLTLVSTVDTPVEYRYYNGEDANGRTKERLVMRYGTVKLVGSISTSNPLRSAKGAIKSVNVYSSRIIPIIDPNSAMIYDEHVPDTQINLRLPISRTYLKVNPALASFSFIEQEPLYKIASIPIEEFLKLDSVKLSLRNIETGVVIPNDEQSHHRLGANGIAAYNSRAMLLGVKTKLFGGHSNLITTNGSEAGYAVSVATSGGDMVVQKGASIEALSNCGFILSYPDVRATKLYLKDSLGTLSYKLKPHPLLNLAYATVWKPPTEVGNAGEMDLCRYFFDVASYDVIEEAVTGYKLKNGYYCLFCSQLSSGSFTTRNNYVSIEVEAGFIYGDSGKPNYANTPVNVDAGVAESSIPAPTDSLLVENNRMQLTEAGMPFSYPARLSYQLDGSVVGVAQNSIPISTGQFGAHPLLIATTMGWRAAQLGAGEVYIEAIQPLNGLSPTSRRHIVNANTSVVFATADGLYLMRGAEVVKISEALEERNAPEEVFELDKTIGHAQLGALPVGALSSASFLAYLSGAGMAYSVADDELIVSNPAYGYSYLYSLSGSQWYKVSESYKNIAVSYPKLYALRPDNPLDFVELTREQPAVQRTLMLTRAMRIDGSAFKTIDRLFANGQLHVDPEKVNGKDKYFRAGLYISYDGSKFRMVDRKDLRGKALNAAWLSSGYSGKLFKLLLCGQLLPESSITTVDVESSEGFGS